MGESSSHNLRWTVCVAVALGALIAVGYAPVFTAGFVNYDDHRYITANPHVRQGLTANSVIWALTTFDVANWHPLTWLSHMLDVELFGLDNPGAHHAVNVLLHAANAVLLLVFLQLLTGSLWRSAFVAALFALHPLHVESVAWVSERKDVLSTCLGLCSMLAYLKFLRQREPGRYVLSVGLYALSLMAKPTLVTLPFVLILLDWWPLGRFAGRASSEPESPNSAGFRRILIEKGPFFALAVVSSVITMKAQVSGGAVSALEAVPLGERIGNAVVGYATYLRQMAWPLDLGPLYPLPQGGWPISTVLISGALLLVITVVAAMSIRRSRAILVGWLWFLGTLAPMIGLVQIGSAAHADRYTYFPLIGVFIMLAWSVPESWLRRREVLRLTILATCGVLAALIMVTRTQAGYWSDSITLSQRAIAVTAFNPIAHFNLGNAWMERGEVDLAIAEFQAAEQQAPHLAYIPNNLGNALARDPARLDQAIAAYQRALQVQPQFWEASGNLGLALARANRLEEAGQALMAAVALQPEDAALQLNLGNVQARLGRYDEAISHFSKCLEIDPNITPARLSLAAALVSTGAIEAARQQLVLAAQQAERRSQPDLLREIQRRLGNLAAASQPQASPGNGP